MGRADRDNAERLRAAVWPGQVARLAAYAVVVAGAVRLATLSGCTVAFRIEVIGLGLIAPVVVWRLGYRTGLVGEVGPTRTARTARRVCLGVLAGCVLVGIQTIRVTLPREGSNAGAAGLSLLIVFLAVYAALGLAATSAAAGLPARTLAAAGILGAVAGLGWCALMPFDQTWALHGAWSTVGYPLALALVVVGAPAAAAVLATPRTGATTHGVVAGACTGGLGALVMLAGGWSTVGWFPRLLDSPLLHKGPGWRPPDVVEQVITSYLLILVVAPLLGALIGWLAATAATRRGPFRFPAGWRGPVVGARRLAAGSALAMAGLLVYPGVSAAVAHDHTAFRRVGATQVVFSPAGGTLLTSNADGTWILWNVTDATHPTRLLTFNDDVRYSPDGRVLASRNTLWDLTEPTRPTRITGYGSGEPVAFSVDGTLLATHRTRTTTDLWRVADRTRPIRLSTIPASGDGFFTPDQRTLVTREDTATTLWDLTDPRHPTRRAVLTGGASGPPSPDGTVLATNTDAGVLLWSLADRDNPRRIAVLSGTRDPTNPGGVIGPSVFSPDGRTVALPTPDGGVALFDTTSASRTATLPPAPDSPDNRVQIGASDTLTTIAFGPDGRNLSVITGNATVSVWDLADPTHPIRSRILTRHTNGAGRVAFSPDTSAVAGAATDGSNSITVWRLR